MLFDEWEFRGNGIRRKIAAAPSLNIPSLLIPTSIDRERACQHFNGCPSESARDQTELATWRSNSNGHPAFLDYVCTSQTTWTWRRVKKKLGALSIPGKSHYLSISFRYRLKFLSSSFSLRSITFLSLCLRPEFLARDWRSPSSDLAGLLWPVLYNGRFNWNSDSPKT